MNGPCAHLAHRCCGLLLGVLLALGPVAQSLGAAQGPCGRTPASDTAPATVEALSVAATGAQWTCPDGASASVIRALPPDRPDGLLSGGEGSLLDDERPRYAPVQWRKAAPVRSSISPVLAVLRPVVLQI
jgi:hypothetical protein